MLDVVAAGKEGWVVESYTQYPYKTMIQYIESGSISTRESGNTNLREGATLVLGKVETLVPENVYTSISTGSWSMVYDSTGKEEEEEFMVQIIYRHLLDK